MLLDHELSHFTPPAADKNGNLRWAILEHGLQEFSEVVQCSAMVSAPATTAASSKQLAS